MIYLAILLAAGIHVFHFMLLIVKYL
jgi:hypothetical protein